MITIEQIPIVIKSMNEGGIHPEAVEAVGINRSRNIYSLVYFDGLGLYKVDEETPILFMSDEDVKKIK